MHTRLEPKLYTILKEGYSRSQFYSDLVAGIVVGVVALPLAIAFAIASGVKPEQGLYTAIIAGAVIAIFSGSRVQISGPTGAFIVVIYQIVQEFGYDGLAVATVMAGLMLIAMGLLGMGRLVRFVPYPLTVGFTSGIALIIFSSQIKDFLGLHIETMPANFVLKLMAIFDNLSSASLSSVAIGVLTLAIIIFWPRSKFRIPGSLVAIVVLTSLTTWFNLPVETIGSRFGSVPNTLPEPRMIHLSWDLFTKMFSPAMTIAVLGAIESLLAAMVADGMMGTRHRSNMELVAQGIGNIVSPLFLGIPATGAIARTGTNVKNGGKTPISALIHALTLLLIMRYLGPLAALIPMPVLAGILIHVAYNMSEWRTFIRMLRAPKSDVAVLLATFLLTVFIDLTVAIEVGMVLSAFLFLQRMESASEMGLVTSELVKEDEEEDQDDELAISKRSIPKGIEVFEIYGPLFFGAVERFKNAMQRIESAPKVLILRMRHVPVIDASGLQALEELLAKCIRTKTDLLLSGVRSQAREAIEESGVAEKIGFERIHKDIDSALEHAEKLINSASRN